MTNKIAIEGFSVEDLCVVSNSGQPLDFAVLPQIAAPAPNHAMCTLETNYWQELHP